MSDAGSNYGNDELSLSLSFIFISLSLQEGLTSALPRRPRSYDEGNYVSLELCRNTRGPGEGGLFSRNARKGIRSRTRVGQRESERVVPREWNL